MSETTRLFGNICTSCVVVGIVVLSVVTAATLVWVMLM